MRWSKISCETPVSLETSMNLRTQATLWPDEAQRWHVGVCDSWLVSQAPTRCIDVRVASWCRRL